VTVSITDRIAIACEPSGTSLTQAELHRQSAQLMGALYRHGLVPGDAIVVLLENCVEFGVVLKAALQGGLRFLALNTHISAAEVTSIIEEVQPKAFITSAMRLKETEGLTDKLAVLDPDMVRILLSDEFVEGWLQYRSLLETEPGDCVPMEGATEKGKILLTSGGTTGRPKVILHEGPNLLGIVEGIMPTADDTLFVPGPLYHSGPLSFLALALTQGISVVIMDGKRDAHGLLRCIDRHKITMAFLVPPMMLRIVAAGSQVFAYNLQSLRLVIHGAGPISVEDKRAWIRLLAGYVPDCRTLELYGASEMLGVTLIWNDEWIAHPGSVGRPVGCEIAIRDIDGNELSPGEVGVVWLYRPDGGRMSYHCNEEETNRTYRYNDGRCEGTTWDLGRVERDGEKVYLYLQGRLKDMVIIGGVNIYPVVTEDVLIAHPDVEDVAVIGMEHAELSEALHAVVQVRTGITPDAHLEAELMELCRQQLGTFQVPRGCTFMPVGRREDGKVNKQILREKVQARA
jgi:long-chain acyl-CoA synthetase